MLGMGKREEERVDKRRVENAGNGKDGGREGGGGEGWKMLGMGRVEEVEGGRCLGVGRVEDESVKEEEGGRC